MKDAANGGKAPSSPGAPAAPLTAVQSGRAAPPPLTDAERLIIADKGTEPPFTGKYWDHFERGVYACRQCGALLYLAPSKFESRCGWPSFDDEIPGAVKRSPDPDGRRTEITCAACGGHLGHVFPGEKLTGKDTRHCVNSASIQFIPESQWPLRRACLAGGCFWGVEHFFRQMKGALAVTSGYMGGTTERPTYQDVCTGKTGHAETVEVLYDPARVTYEELGRLFFEIHDPTTLNRQGPDAGTQYRSAIFYTSEAEKQTAEKLIGLLGAKGCNVVTQVVPAAAFWPAEAYHQDYLRKHPERPSCHVRVPRFEAK